MEAEDLKKYIQDHPELKPSVIAQKLGVSASLVHYYKHSTCGTEKGENRPYTHDTAFLIRKWYKEYTTGENRPKSEKKMKKEDAILCIANILQRSFENVMDAFSPKHDAAVIACVKRAKRYNRNETCMLERMVKE